MDKRLNFVKTNMTINALKEYLEEQWYSTNIIKEMFMEKKIGIIIRHDKKLWELRDNPEKIYRNFFD